MTTRKPALVVGAAGRMGERVRAALARHPELRVAAALEAADCKRLGEEIEEGVMLTSDVGAALADVAVAIDFTVPDATLANLGAAADAGVAYVTGTTGFDEAQRGEIARFAQRIPVVHAPNFSLAVNVLGWLTQEAARRLGPGFDAELVEIHHAAKRDAPSGTALYLAEKIVAGRGETLADRLVLTRAGDTGPRPEGAVAIQTLRGGDNPGEHTVLFVGQGERVELAHRALTRDHFAHGALRAAAWLIGRGPGLYSIEEVFGLAEPSA